MKTSHIKETKNKAEEKQVQAHDAVRGGGRGETEGQGTQPPSSFNYTNSNHMDTVHFFFLHENGKNPEYTITYSAGEALLSHH